MKWYHEVDRDWLQSRKSFLNASDIQRLLPTTATGRPRKNLDEAYLRVWAEKQCAVTDDDVVSTGVMARGHILEPYAVAEFNKLSSLPELFHIDDTIVYRDEVSCSPDALDIQLTKGMYQASEAISVAEIKCYNGSAHYIAGATPAAALDERWQLATAFYTMPTIETGWLVFFNPAATHPLFVKSYDRDSLKPELAMIELVVKDYRDAVKALELNMAALCSPILTCPTEDEIVAELIAKQIAEHEADGLDPL